MPTLQTRTTFDSRTPWKTCDFFIKSAFNESQIISVYYLVKAKSELLLSFKDKMYDFDAEGDLLQAFRWKNITELRVEDVTFPTDQKAVALIIERWHLNRDRQ